MTTFAPPPPRERSLKRHSQIFGAAVSALCGLLPLGLVCWIAPPPLQILAAVGIVSLTLPAVCASLVFSPWWPTPARELDRICCLADLSEGHRFCELGCGDARVTLHLARSSGASCVGIDLSPFHLGIAVLRRALHPSPRARFVLGDLMGARIDDFDVFYVYGVPETLRGAFSEKLRAQGKRGARVLAYDHPIEGLALERCDQPAPDAKPIYIYRIGSNEDR